MDKIPNGFYKLSTPDDLGTTVLNFELVQLS
jgi:hypothetical protein